MKAHYSSVTIFFKFSMFVVACFLVVFTNLMLKFNIYSI